MTKGAKGEQLLFWRVDGRKLVEDAIAEHNPVAIFALFSGGNDSSVLTDWAWRTLGERLTAAVHIDTGTAVPGVREFVEGFCEQRGIALKVYEAGTEYRHMVLSYGFPGRGAHRFPYVRLKERQIDRLVREHKTVWRGRVMLLSGVRRSESERRMGKATPMGLDGAQVWVNPLIDWQASDMRRYRSEFGVEESDVAALLHRSGECNCGAFAKDGEREELFTLFPEMRWIERLEQEVASEGIARCEWGKDYGDDPDGLDARLCKDCQPALFVP